LFGYIPEASPTVMPTSPSKRYSIFSNQLGQLNHVGVTITYNSTDKISIHITENKVMAVYTTVPHGAKKTCHYPDIGYVS
jgi:hypothetical protein